MRWLNGMTMSVPTGAVEAAATRSALTAIVPHRAAKREGGKFTISRVLKAKSLPDGRGEPGLVEGVEVQSRRPRPQQVVTQPGDDVEPVGANRSGVVPVAFQPQPQPARDLGAAGVREARELREIADRHDTGDDGDRDARRLAFVHEAEVGIRVIRVL